MRLFWVVGVLVVGCTLTPAPSTWTSSVPGTGQRPSPSPDGESGGLSSAPQGEGSNPSTILSLTPDPSPNGRGAIVVTPSPAEKGGKTITPSPLGGAGKIVTPDSSPLGLSRECEKEICILEVAFPFQRPIQPPGTDTVDPTYRYGSTQQGQREVHHGVEFINKAGVPVYAVADGVVAFAGEDEDVSFATKRGFYGKVIILRHNLQGEALPLYTVYGHLLNLRVQSGETVRQGQLIGEVGLGGVAAGTHLHFEVRYRTNDYDATRNPELWLPPALPESGLLMGRFLDSQGQCLTMENIVLEPLGAENALLERRYLSTYEDPAMHCLPPWRESFGINDLPAGTYRLSYIYTKPETLIIEVLAGKVTYLNLHLP